MSSFSPRPGIRRHACRRLPAGDPAWRRGSGRRRARALARHPQSQIGSEVEPVNRTRALGRTPQFAAMELAQPASPGQVLRARVTASDGKRLRGELLGPKLAL
jgi:hypothetical protein